MKLRDIPIENRLSAIQPQTKLSDDDIRAVQRGLTLEQAGHMIENVVGLYSLPLGIAQNFLINGREYLVPMVIEEASVVAACSFAAKLTRETGGFVAASTDPIMIGQIQTLDVPDVSAAKARLAQAAPEWIDWLNTQNPSTMSKHARAVGLEVREIPPSPLILSLSKDGRGGETMLIVHLLYDCGDAMGANLINTACEALAPRVELLTGGRVNLRILSNLSDRRMARASCVIRAKSLGDDASAVQRIEEASLFAEADPYRATTHNKGVMNGVDAVVMATGNDWRAVEAAAHAHAARDGRYTSMTKWRVNADGDLAGEIELPMAVGTVGGATRSHPVAQAALKILGVQTARELAEVIACVGLAQNFAAIRALAMEGIQRGHMALHARQIAISAGATGDQIERVAARMIEEGRIRLDRARELIGDGGRKTGDG